MSGLTPCTFTSFSGFRHSLKSASKASETLMISGEPLPMPNAARLVTHGEVLASGSSLKIL